MSCFWLMIIQIQCGDFMGNIVEVKDLCVNFSGFFAVKNVSFTVENGEIFGFLGANGAGKTTTIRVICGLIHATSGEVIVDGEKFVKGNESIIKSKVGYMSQKFTLYDDLTIKENIDFAATIRGVSQSKLNKTKNELFDLVQVEENENRMVGELPSGIKQQVALVSSLIHDPKLVVLDEPTAGVSPAARAHFWDLIKKLTKIGKTVFVTTHYMDEAENCDRVALMRSGELISLGTIPYLKESTFKNQMYRLTPKIDVPLKDLKDIESECNLFKAYGIHYHCIFKNESNINKFNDLFDIEKISPTLEDVFIQKVEGELQ